MISGARASLGLFVGRAAEVARIAAASAERLVTVRGPAGVGKTRLVMEHLAQTQRPHFFVDLSDANDEHELAGATWRALGVSDGAARGESEAALLEAAGERLVVLDNYEQLLPAGARVLERWLAAAPLLRVMVTSRAELGLPGELVIELGPLSIGARSISAALDGMDSEALCLMRDRVQRARADYVLDEAERKHCEPILEALDGLPLAIEIVAPRIARFGAEAVAKRLSRRLEWRGAGGSSLSDVLTTSWDLLEEPERETFAALSVFRGGFDLDAVEHVVEADADVMSLVDGLASKSLIQAHAEQGASARMTMFRSVRDWVCARLDEAEAARLGARHAAFFASTSRIICRDLHGVDAPAAWRWLSRERENLMAASSCAHAAPQDAARCLLALCKLAIREGPMAPLTTIASAMSAQQVRAGELAIELDVAQAHALHKMGRAADAEVAAERAVRGAEAYPQLVPSALYARASVALARGELEQVMRWCALGMEAAAAHEDRVIEAMCGRLAGNAAQGLGQVAEARAMFERARASFADLGELREESISSALLGSLCLDEGRLEEAELHLSSAGAIAAELEDRFGEAFIVANLGMVHHRAGSLCRAIEGYDAAIDVFARMGTFRHRAAFDGYRGLAQLELGRLDDARRGLRAAAGQLRSAGDVRFSAFFDAMCAVAELARAGTRETLTRIDAAAARLTPTGDALLGVAIALARARVAEVAAQEAEARGDAASARLHREVYEAAIRDAATPDAQGRAPAQVSFEVFLAQRVCVGEPQPSRAAAPGSAALDSEALSVAEDGSWLRVAGERSISLQHRPSLKRLLAALIAARTRAPGQPLSRESLQASGWPGERIRPSAAANRVRVGLATLRRLGLRDAIRTEPTGWMLDPAASLSIHGAAQTSAPSQPA